MLRATRDLNPWPRILPKHTRFDHSATVSPKQIKKIYKIINEICVLSQILWSYSFFFLDFFFFLSLFLTDIGGCDTGRYWPNTSSSKYCVNLFRYTGAFVRHGSTRPTRMVNRSASSTISPAESAAGRARLLTVHGRWRPTLISRSTNALGGSINRNGQPATGQSGSNAHEFTPSSVICLSPSSDRFAIDGKTDFVNSSFISSIADRTQFTRFICLSQLTSSKLAAKSSTSSHECGIGSGSYRMEGREGRLCVIQRGGHRNISEIVSS